MDLRPTTFLDTNGLHYIFSYLRHAKNFDLPPYKKNTYQNTKQILNSQLPPEIAHNLLNGAKALAFLMKKVKDEDVAIYTSRFAKAEILYGSLEGQAHARMVREGTIYRMRQRIGTLSELVSRYLDPSDFNNVVQGWDNNFLLFEQKGIRIEITEIDNFRQVADVAEFLQSKIFVDVLDSWMYSNALILQADQVVTFDNYFRELINKIADPLDDDWKELRQEVLNYLQQLFIGIGNQINISFPHVCDLSSDVPEMEE